MIFPDKYAPILVAVLALMAIAPCQEARFFRTDDGSRFLLVPVRSQSVNWVNLQPAGPNEEPPQIPGLGMAIARASVLGDTQPARGQTSALAWEKALRDAPASGSRVMQVADYVGVAVTFTEQSLETVARLLRVRMTREVLLGVQQQLDAVQRERSKRIRAIPHLGIMRRTVASFEAARPLLSALAEPANAEASDAVVMSFYRRTYAPAKSLNVITGNLRLDNAERLLKATFATPLPDHIGEAPERGVAGPQAKARRDSADTLMLGCPIPANLDANAMLTLDLLIEYLAGDVHSYLPDHLRACGHPRVRVYARAPFPADGGIFLISVTKPGATLTEDAMLTVHLEQALAKVATDEPDADRMDRAVASLRAARSAILQQPEGLATLIARRWARTGAPPIAGLAEESRISGGDVRALAKRVFSLAGQSLVLPEVRK